MVASHNEASIPHKKNTSCFLVRILGGAGGGLTEYVWVKQGSWGQSQNNLEKGMRLCVPTAVSPQSGSAWNRTVFQDKKKANGRVLAIPLMSQTPADFASAEPCGSQGAWTWFREFPKNMPHWAALEKSLIHSALPPHPPRLYWTMLFLDQIYLQLA